jgi:uncharacterized protein YqeY
METKIQKEIMSAMKSQDKVRLDALRAIKTAITTFKTSPNYKGNITDGDIINIIQKLVKQRQDSIEIYKNAGRNELAEKEMEEMNVMSEFLPKMMSEDELKEVIQASGCNNIGAVMKYLKEKYNGLYDGKMASRLIKEVLG